MRKQSHQQPKATFRVLLFVLSLIFTACSGQPATPAREFYNKDFKWKITIPENFESVSAEESKKLEDRGTEAIEDTYGEKIVNQARGIFTFKSTELNYFDSNYQPFDEAVDGNYLESCKGVNDVLYETFTAQIPGVQIDSARFVEKIDGLEFQAFKMKMILPNKIVMNLLMYSRLFDKREFTVNIMYVDEAKGKQLKDAWMSSKFSR